MSLTELGAPYIADTGMLPASSVALSAHVSLDRYTSAPVLPLRQTVAKPGHPSLNRKIKRKKVVNSYLKSIHNLYSKERRKAALSLKNCSLSPHGKRANNKADSPMKKRLAQQQQKGRL